MRVVMKGESKVYYMCKLDDYIDVDLHVCNGKCHLCPYGIIKEFKEE